METGIGWDTGLARKLNEDSVFCSSFKVNSHSGNLSVGLFTVADGMGGHNAGEVASDMAVKVFCTEVISSLLGQSRQPPLKLMERAFIKANNTVMAAARDKELEGMGTTLTAALIIGADLYVAHVGDSRCMLINEREILQVTRDHSIVQQLVDTGQITPAEARSHPRRNEITRVLGCYADTAADLLHVKLYHGDAVLLCSDGLCGIIPDDVIAATVLHSSSADDACRELVETANSSGGPDNISVIIVQPGNLPLWQAMINARTSVGSA